MTSYQKLKQKCEYLQSQVDMFKNALTIVRQEPQVVENNGTITTKLNYAIFENRVNQEIKERLNRWVAFNLDEDTIKKLLELKHDKK